MKHEFECKLIAKGPGGAWTHLPLPFNAEEVFGRRGRIPVSGTLNGFPFRRALTPLGNAEHYMMVDKTLKAGANTGPGQQVHVVLELDLEERRVEVPEELAAQLAHDHISSAAFARLAYSHQKEYTDWISTAKRPETRTKRAAQAVEMLRAGKRFR
jgi:hypothetical protein